MSHSCNSLARRFAQRGEILGEEIHLLRHAAFDDRVVLVEAHGQRLAIEHLFADLRLEQALELRRRRLRQSLRALG